MLVHNGLICNDCEATEESVFYARRDGPPACTECGGERRVWWGHGRAPGLHSDEKGGMDIGAQPGTREYELSQTRTGMKQLIGELQAERPGKTIRIRPPGRDREVEAEERKHELWRRRKERGVDMQTHDEARKAKRRAAAEAQREAAERGVDKKTRKAIVKEKVGRALENG